MADPIEILKESNETNTNLKPSRIFGRLLREGGYMRDADGQDHCADCFKKLPNIGDYIDDCTPSSQYLTDASKTLRVKEGYYIECCGLGNDDFTQGISNTPCPNTAKVFVSDDGLIVEVNGIQIGKERILELSLRNKKKKS